MIDGGFSENTKAMSTAEQSFAKYQAEARLLRAVAAGSCPTTWRRCERWLKLELGRLVCLLLKPKRMRLANFVLAAVFGYMVLAG